MNVSVNLSIYSGYTLKFIYQILIEYILYLRYCGTPVLEIPVGIQFSSKIYLKIHGRKSSTK